MCARVAAVLLAAGITSLAAVNNVAVQGTTSTQAVLQYTAPDGAACTVEVSEFSSFSPLVHDVNPQLFPGSNLDSRSESTANGSERLFVIGKRRAERATNGHWYSRALQAYTAHYYRITCGADQATGSFSTANIPLGNTYNDELPGDPNAGSAGYFVNAGEYAWPEFIDWNNSTGRAESVIDPQTGMLLKRLTMPGDQMTGNRPAGDHTFVAAISPTGAWNNPGNSLGDDGASASFSGAGRDWLLLRDSALAFYDYPLESLMFSVKGWCAGPCAGDDARIQACLTVNGISCWPNQSNTIDMTLGTTSNTSSYVTAGSTLPIMAAWTPAGFLPLNPTDTKARSGNVNVDAAGVVTLAGGDLFYPNWTAGSKFTVAGSECNVVSVAHPKALTIDPASCASALTMPLTNAPYSAGNFGIMVRKKTSSTDTINVQYAKYSLTETNTPGWSASGSPEFCSHALTQNSVTGAMGYHCRIMESQLFWVDRATGVANYLGLYYFGSADGTDGWDNGVCTNASVTILGGVSPLDPESFYCVTNDHTGKEIVLACTLASTNQPRDLSIACTNLTRSSANKDLLTLVQQFTNGQSTVFDPVLFNGCGITGIQNGQLIMGCYRGYQDTLAWVVVFDPNKVDSAPGCVGGGQPGCVVGAQASWPSSSNRWCAVHTLFMAGDSNTAWVLGKPLGSNIGIPGGGLYKSNVVSGTLTSTPSIAAGTAGCLDGTFGCDLVTVDGEPCNENPASSVGGHAPEGGNCPKHAAWDYLQDAKPGDIFQVQNNPREYVKLISKAGNSWLIQRGYGYTTPTSVPTPALLQPLCGARTWDHDITGSWTWDFGVDPHGLGANGSIQVGTSGEHPLPRPNLVVQSIGWWQPGYGYGITDGPGYGPPNKWTQLGPAFAGTTGVTVYNELAQDHPSHPQTAAPPQEQKWFLDARPLHGPGGELVDRATKVSGQLYKFASTTTDGDNLTQVGGASAFLGAINRKRQPTMAFCGTQPLKDVSSATQGDAIRDDSSSVYQYCVARKAGECRNGSTQGEIYVNCPYVAPRPDGSFGCDFERGEPSLANDICVNNTGAYLNAAVQFGFEHSDPTGGLARSLTKSLIRYRMLDSNENVHGLPDGSWLMVEGSFLQGAVNEWMTAKLPPYPEVDSVNRGTFVPMLLSLTPPSGLAVDNAVVLFGYAENGSPENFYCTSRREACLAVSGTITESNPFRFGTDGTNGTPGGVAGLSCATGCSIAIPALPQRVVYYQVLYRDSSNQVVAQTRLQMAVAP